jgi:cytochrome c oxidase assembly protein subunit 15
MQKYLKTAVILAFIVIILGAYTRLKDAGLGCPDWPLCYGHIVAPLTAASFEKAWIEMTHRYVAGALGLLIAFICYKGIRTPHFRGKLNKLCYLLGALVIGQAALGMWTVTLRLYPVVVMLHLLGGLTILSLLWLLYLKCRQYNLTYVKSVNSNLYKQLGILKLLAVVVLLLVILQITLGGWVSANYAALVCNDFPTCQGKLLPPLDFAHAFNVLRAGIFDSPGHTLENTARVTIQMSHRFVGLILVVATMLLSYKLIRSKERELIIASVVLLALLALQVILGMSNIFLGLPVSVALMHNAVAALLLLTIITINFMVFNYAKPTDIKFYACKA